MNDAPRKDAPRPPIQVGTIHYQILCGAGLLLICLTQLDQGIFLGNLLVACVGLLGIISKVRAAPLLLLLVFALAQLGNHLVVGRAFDNQFGREDVRPLLHVWDLLLAIGVVAYVSANYRLQSLWTHILPPDARQREATSRKIGRWWRREISPVQQKRDTRLLTPQEIARFVLALPLWALLGQAMWIVIARPWALPVFEQQRIHRLIALAWLLIVGAVVIGAILAQWRRRQMDPTAAALVLQDTLWKETRREQRRTFRWLAWRKLHERAEQHVE